MSRSVFAFNFNNANFAVYFASLDMNKPLPSIVGYLLSRASL